jgi:biopolymer transport protein ExbD
MKMRRRSKEAPLPYVPMADLAFNLVLFFIILAKAQQDEFAWEKAQSPGTQEITSARVTVAVDKDSKVYVNGFQVGVRDLAEEVNKLLGDSGNEKRKPCCLYRPQRSPARW